MTVCIAAICKAEGRYAVVVCSDWKVSGPLGSAETALKQRRLPHGWYCLTAGTESDIIALCKSLEAKFKEPSTIDDANVTGLVREAILQRKTEKSDEYTIGKYGIRYSEFLRIGRDKLPIDEFNMATRDIANIDLRADLIIIGFDSNKMPIICHTNSKGVVSIKENFSVVGEGEYLAAATLFQREQNDSNSVEETLYHVYEAKKYAEKVPSVGEFTSIVILFSDRYTQVKREGREKLEEFYKRFGPQRIDKKALKAASSELMTAE